MRGWLTHIRNHEAVDALGRGDASGGYPAAMAAVGDTLAQQSRVQFVPPLDIMRFYTCAGRVDQALQWLETAFQARDADLPYIACAPTNDLIRDHARFREIVRQMNLPGGAEAPPLRAAREAPPLRGDT